jgi:galactose mutarotase-like enzyme
VSEPVAIRSDVLSATISTLGAELQTLRDGSGRNLLWDGDPAFWTGRAPLLFPIVGALRGGSYRLAGRNYSLPQHGFARRRRFDLLACDEGWACFRLRADEETRAVYPFEFTLDARYTLEGPTLGIEIIAANLGDTAMPASVGFHPAFRWPLPFGAPREAHRLLFDKAEPGGILRLTPDGLDMRPRPTPISGTELTLNDRLFDEDALILSAPRSERLRYDAPGTAGLEIAWPGMPSLGIWSKPGAGFVCIEPWQGHADPAGFAGELREKPGMVEIEPGSSLRFAMSATLTSPREPV